MKSLKISNFSKRFSICIRNTGHPSDSRIFFWLANVFVSSIYEPAMFKQMNKDMFGDGPHVISSCSKWQSLRLFLIILTSIRQHYMGLAKLRATVDLRNLVYENILEQPISFFDQNQSGELSTLLASNCGTIASYTPDLIASVAKDIFFVVGDVMYVVNLSWQLTLLVLVSAPVIGLVTIHFGDKKRMLSEEIVASEARCNGTSGEAFSGARTIRSMAAESNELRKYYLVNEENYSIRSKDVGSDSTHGFLVDFAWRLISWGVYVCGHYLRECNIMDGQGLSVFVVYHCRSLGALTRLIKTYSDGMKTIGKSKKVLEILSSNPKSQLNSGIETPNVVGGITIENVDFAYEINGKRILKSLNLSIAPGQTVALVGPSGHGKSTIVSLLQRFYAPTSGRILLDQTPIVNIDHKFYHSKVALVGQEPVLFSGTIRENILYGYDEGTEADMIRVARMANVDEFVSKMTGGYDTVIVWWPEAEGGYRQSVGSQSSDLDPRRGHVCPGCGIGGVGSASSWQMLRRDDSDCDSSSAINCFLYEPILYKRMQSDMFRDGPHDLSSCVKWQLVRLVTIILLSTKEYYMGLAKLRATVDLRNSVHENILHQPISFFDQNQSGELSTLLSSNCGTIASYTPELIASVATDVFMVIGDGMLLLTCSWQLTLTILLSAPAISFVSIYFGNERKMISEETVASDSRCSGITGEAFSGARTIRSMAAESNELRRYNLVNEEYYNIRSKDVGSDSSHGFLVNFGWRLDSLLIYWYGHYLRKYNRLDGQEFHTFVIYHFRAIYALTRLIKLHSEGMKTIGKSKKVLDLLSSDPKSKLLSGTEKPSVIGGITIEDVDFAYEIDGKRILKSLNLSIAPGQTVALVGPSGHGKSTLVSLLQRFYAPSSGRILLDGTPIENIDHKFYHSKVALVAQEPVLFSGTIRENILYGYDEGSEEDMMRVARMANVDEFVSKMADGYDTVCGERGVRLSGGQKQRVAIARALVRNPQVLILDEATSALDVESEALVQEALSRCSQDMTVLVIAHRLSTVRNADKIAVIENGSVSAQGTHEELMEDSEGTYFKLVTRQSNVIG
ncbi:hypothetical protein L3Y34_006558 [Caenorhabditis briggsae]|uniref:Uncharacterized protein n=1 Tax=Caenorhabditis briggsae TaxID=6238 RepID=A0AAE8ZZR9_CAEBR|nr:hypothetical protein L3Y34_006558 [Caenorhabditis briggsae]